MSLNSHRPLRLADLRNGAAEYPRRLIDNRMFGDLPPQIFHQAFIIALFFSASDWGGSPVSGVIALILTTVSCPVNSCANARISFVVVTDGTANFSLKIDHDTDIDGFVPGATFDVIGIVQQDDYLRPFDSGYNVAPRSAVDLGATAPPPPPLLTIAEARVDAVTNADGNPPRDTIPNLLGHVVTVRGAVTSIDLRGGTGIEYYIQDATGGIDLFSTSLSPAFNIGDNVEATGTITQFNGLTELTVTAVSFLGAGTAPARRSSRCRNWPTASAKRRGAPDSRRQRHCHRRHLRRGRHLQQRHHRRRDRHQHPARGQRHRHRRHADGHRHLLAGWHRQPVRHYGAVRQRLPDHPAQPRRHHPVGAVVSGHHGHRSAAGRHRRHALLAGAHRQRRHRAGPRSPS